MHTEPQYAPDPAAEARAIDWLVRQRDPGFADWDAFADWLAEAPDHAAIYDAVASLDADLDVLPPAAAPAYVAAPPPRREVARRAWFGGAIAAAIVGTLSLSSLGLLDGGRRIETAAGEHRTIALADGSKIEMNGATVLALDDDHPRFARIERGEAMFHIVHRVSDPFVVEAGAARIVDLGTAFNVVRGRHRTAVAVSEGVVAYNPDGANVRIAAGQGIEAVDGEAKPPVVRPVDAATVGGWRTGLLVYGGTPLPVVAEDLERTAGMKVRIAPEAADVAFRGTLIVAENRGRTVADLAALSGTRAEKDGDGWVIAR